MPQIITNIRFFEYGKTAPLGSRFKGIMNTESVIGFYEYTSDLKKAEESQQLGYIKQGFLGYTSRGSNLRTYSHLGWIDDKKVHILKNTIRNSFHQNGDLIWDTVVSLENFAIAAEHQINNADDFVAVVSKILPSFFRYTGFDPQNMGYWMNYHTDKFHPHIHLSFFELHKTRTKGKLPQKCIDKFHSLFVKEIALRNEFRKTYGIESKDFFGLVDEKRKKLLSHIKERDLSELSDIHRLYAKLPKQGRFSYHSQNIAKYRQEIDSITGRLLEEPQIAEVYESWLGTIQQLEQFQNDYAQRNISTLQETEIKKLYALIGNTILHSFKEYREELSTRKVSVPLDRLEKNNAEYILDLSSNQMRIHENIIKIHDDLVEIDLSKDEYHFVDTESGEDIILDQTEVIDLLKDEMKKDKLESNSNLKMSFSGYHSKQAKRTFPTANLNKAVQLTISQQLREKEHDLDVYLHQNKKNGKEV